MSPLPFQIRAEMNGFMLLIMICLSMLFGLIITLDAVGITLPEYCTMIQFIGGILYMLPSVILFLVIYAEQIDEIGAF